MGLEKFLTNVYLGESSLLNKRWVVKAQNIEDAAGKVISFCKKELAFLEANSLDKNVDVDLKFTLLEKTVSEI